MNVGEFEGSGRLRIFLLGYRWFALLLGFSLIDFMGTPKVPILNELPSFLAQQPQMFMGVVALYHLAASVYAYKASDRFSAYIVLLADAGTGCLLSYFFGLPFLLLTLGLPALEAALFFGINGMILMIVAISAFYLPALGSHIIKYLRDPEQSTLLQELLKIQGIGLLLYLWLFSSSVSQGGDFENSLRRIIDEKNLAFEELQNTKRELKDVFNELDKRQHAVNQFQADIQKKNETLEDITKQLNEAKLQSQATQQMVQDKETRISEKLKSDSDMIARLSDRYNKLLSAFQSLAHNLTLEETSVNLVDELLKLMPVQTCLLFLMEENEAGKELFAEVAASPYSDYFRNFNLGLGEGAPGWVAYTRKMLTISEGAIRIDGQDLPTLLTYEKSALLAPIIYEDECLGVLYLGQPEANAFDDEDEEMVTLFSSLVASLLHHATLFQKMVSRGFVDEVSGLYNSPYFQERFSEEIKRADRFKFSFSLILIEIDHNETIIEKYGKNFGDRLAKEVASMILLHANETDVAARLENNVFALMVQSDKSGALLTADRIRMAAAVRTFSPTPEEKVNITLSSGISTYPPDADDKEGLAEKAEAALEKAKNEGGNRTLPA
ncbi:MAG: diguanylate cyclase [Chloroflexi bacterium]|nr:diguanylate cyclase [Chloroflexota bacterium]